MYLCNTISKKMRSVNVKLIIEAWFKFFYIIGPKALLFVSLMWCRRKLPASESYDQVFLTNVHQLHFSCHYWDHVVFYLFLHCVLYLLFRIHCKIKVPCKLYLVCALFYLRIFHFLSQSIFIVTVFVSEKIECVWNSNVSKTMISNF